MPRKLQTQLSLTMALVVLITISLISFLSNIVIGKAFDSYIQQKQAFHSGEIAANINRQYDPMTRTWDIGFVHGIGMYALYDGYIIKLYDVDGNTVWDAENHDASLCSQMMTDISQRMKTRRPDLSGKVMSGSYPLSFNGQTVGTVEITYYGPYFFSESDILFLDTLNLLLLTVGVISFVCSLVAGYFLARRITRPVAQAAEAARAISQGDYGVRFDGDGGGTRELAELTQAIDALAQTISRQETLRKRLTSDVAHELRTPLSAVAAQLETMIENVWPATPERLQGCYDEIGRISGLVAELEKLSTIEDENLQLNRSPVDLLARAKAAVGYFEAVCHTKHIAISAVGSRAVIFGDPDKIDQVLVNLLSNAVKYTPRDGHIKVTVLDEEQGILTVEDDGAGIDAAELPYIFERFYRTDQSRSRATGGAGIGLSIVRAIVLAHGGTIEAKSEQGKGSRFIVRLPKA